MRLTVRLSMAVVALAAALLSYQSLMHLGELAGYGWLAPLYPVVVDAGAAASCAAWLYTRGRQPLVMTWCLLAVSVVLNGTTHYLESTHTAPSWLLVVAVAAVPPTVLGLTVHLAVDMSRPGQEERDVGEAGSTAPEEMNKGASDGTALEETHDTTSSDPVAELIESGVGRRRIASTLGISEHQARQLLAASRNGDGR